MSRYDTILALVGASLAGIAVASQVSTLTTLIAGLVGLTLVAWALFVTSQRFDK